MINFNGNITSKPEFSPYNRGLLYGDALFETMRCINGKIIFWEDHYLRLMASMRILRMDIPMYFTMENLEKEVYKLLDAQNLDSSPARVRITIYRNDGGRYLPEDNGVGFYAFAEAVKDSFYVLDSSPYEVDLYKDHFINADLLSTLKTTNKIIQVTASIFAKENGYANCLLLNTNKSVVEALQGNLFLVKGKYIKTPPLEEGCLRGIIRKQLIEILKKLPQYTFEESAISPFELQKADELFITNTIMGIRPITKYRKKSFSDEVARDLLGKLNARARLS